jgi:hypothetical protein
MIKIGILEQPTTPDVIFHRSNNIAILGNTEDTMLNLNSEHYAFANSS